MNKSKRKEKRLSVQDFRYGIIAELLNPYLGKKNFKKLLEQKAGREYEIPYSTKKSITKATICNWIKLFKMHGKAGLLPQKRTDKGKSKSLNIEEQTILINYLESNPEVCASSALNHLKKQGKIVSEISQSSLSRFIISNNLTRKNRMYEKSTEKNIKYQFKYPLECIQADAMHAFAVPNEKGKSGKAILLAFIDDATRRIVYSNFAFTEKSYEFEKGIKHILASHGHIGKIYTDNGSTFISDQTNRILSILGIPLIHSRPGRPAGRGKIERFFRTVRDQFLRPLDKDQVKSIDELNILFKTWLESEYHRNPHRGLAGETPLEAFVKNAHYIVSVNQSIDLDDVFLHELSRMIYKDNTFSLDGTLFEVPVIPETNKVKIRFNPMCKDKIKLYADGKYIGDAKPVETYANARIVRNTHSKTITETESVLPKDLKHKHKNVAVTSSLSASKI